MANIKKSATELIGNTPLLELTHYEEKNDIKDATILAKLEYLNPAGSVKDRIALNMLEVAETEGKLKPGADFRKYRYRFGGSRSGKGI